MASARSRRSRNRPPRALRFRKRWDMPTGRPSKSGSRMTTARNHNQLVRSSVAQPQTLFDKIWNSHVIRETDDGVHLVHIDRHLLQETTCPPAFAGLRRAGRHVRTPNLTYTVIDHIISTQPALDRQTFEGRTEFDLLISADCR